MRERHGADGEPGAGEELEVDGDLCVHGLSPRAGCRKCVDICPREAFVLDEDQLGFDAAACDGCGLCRPACPQAAISLAMPLTLRADRLDRLVLLAACEKTGSKTANLACVHALGLADLAPLLKRDLREVLIHTGDCEACERGGGARIEQRLEQLNEWRTPRGLKKITFRLLDDSGWRQALRTYDRAAETVDPARRRMFAAFKKPQPATPRAKAPPAELPHFHLPRIDADVCSGCDACLNVCPHQCLLLQRRQNALYYRIDPSRCTGCGLCVDVCSDGAVELLPFGRQSQFAVELVEARCPKCGAPFHQPRREGEEAGQCRICAARDPTSRLFQVQD